MEPSKAAFQTFACLSGAAVALLICEQRSDLLIGGGIPPLQVLIPAGLAILVMWLPSSPTAFLALWGVMAVTLPVGFPQNNTNETLLFLIALSILFSAAISLLRNGWIGWAPENQLTVFAPAVRLCTLGLYFWTVFHKLNRDFINPEVSCATRLGLDLLDVFRIHSIPSFLPSFFVAATIAVELALPVGLLFKRSRTATAILGFIFHWILGVAGYYGFSATMMMCLTLFVTPWMSTGPAWLRLRALNRLALLAIVVGIPLAWWLFGITPYGVGRQLWRILPVGAAAFFLLHRGSFGILPARTSILDDLAKPSLAIVVPLLLFANGLSPYLGYKTEYSFAMYSNLRTEGGQTNHLLIHRPASLASYQTDLVQVEPGSDDRLLKALGGRFVTRYELTSMLWAMVHEEQRTDIRLVLTDGQGTTTFATADREPELVVEPSFLERHLLRFRPIVPARKGECAH